MNGIGCDRVRESIPDFVGGSLDAEERGAVAAHLELCAECREEAALVELLLASKESAPPELADRIHAAVRRRPIVSSTRPWWGLAAAAIAAVALGIGVNARRGTETLEVPGYVAVGEAGDVWLSDDGLIAGAPALDGLSEEALASLLEEMSAGGQV